jgi:AcrR family transcriptional regulator
MFSSKVEPASTFSRQEGRSVMTSANEAHVSWAERAADRSPRVHRSKARSVEQVLTILDAARRLVRERGDSFTTQELAREAGVALQTFYRYFATKDELLLAVLGDLVARGAAGYAEAARDLHGPVARLRFYICSTLEFLDGDDDDAAGARFVVSAHWRLQRVFPDELADAMKPFEDLLLAEINAGVEQGILHPASPAQAANFINVLVRSVFHHYAYASGRPATLREDLWQFCLTALGANSEK